MNSDELTVAVLSLPRDQRAKLAEDLIRSLDEHPVDGDEAWTKEVTRRAHEIADGTVEPVDWEAARARITRRLEERRRAAAASSRG